ncbi:MAG: DegQ family serine endoprotease [Deltaproteobacteria bacterium]|jgi:serine protease Do|nr:DegQ family serine endoprotease [Deltaproteobacteria bacterium]
MDSHFRKTLLLLAAVLAFFWLKDYSAAQNTAPAPVPPAAQGRLVGLPSVAPVVDKAKPAVVNIFTVKTIQRRGPRGRSPSRPAPRPEVPVPPENLDEFFGFPQSPPEVFRERALGSGFIFDQEGFIITNNHVVEGADEIKVKLDDRREIDAEIVGRDPKTDLALIKLKQNGSYPYIKFGSSDNIRIGDWLVAIGNPFGLEHTVTTGILSARGRAIGAGPYDDFLQTDASINPGNSGGPLLDLDGDVVGINTMIYAGSNGIGFAIPSKIAGRIIEQLKNKGYVERGWIGVVIQPLTQDLTKTFGVDSTNGALIGDVLPDTPASRAGLRHGDIVVEFDGKSIGEYGELTAAVADTQVGKEVTLIVVRDKKKTPLKLTVARLEDEQSDNAGQTSGVLDLGLTVREISPETAKRMNIEPTGLLVEQVAENSLAAESGVKVRDIILEIDQKPVKTLQEYNAFLRSHPKGEPVLLWIKRGERTMYSLVKIK